MDYTNSLYYVKILTEEGDLAVTNIIISSDISYTTLKRKIDKGKNDPQTNAICQDCPVDW